MQAGENNTLMPQIQAMRHDNRGPERKQPPQMTKQNPTPNTCPSPYISLGPDSSCSLAHWGLSIS